jgi:hypothetical protein
VRKKLNEIPVMIVTSAISKIASIDPSPLSGENPKYLSMKSMWLHSKKARYVANGMDLCRVNLRLLKLDLGPTDRLSEEITSHIAAGTENIWGTAISGPAGQESLGLFWKMPIMVLTGGKNGNARTRS